METNLLGLGSERTVTRSASSVLVRTRGADDALEDGVEVAEHLVLLHAQDAPAEALKDAISVSIVAAPALVVRTIDLDDQAALRAGEVGDVGPDDQLPAERKASLGA
jgi:hypothetical protein